MNPEAINELIRKRRSLYPQVFSDKQIPREVVEQLLENANWAPTHKLTQPWRFTVFSGEGLKRLGQFQADLYKELTPETEFKQANYDKLLLKPTQCSHVIAIGMARNEIVPEIEEVEAVACAVQNMYLTATAYGIGAYWGSGGVTYKEEAKAFFGLGEKDKLLGFFFMGYPTIEWPEKGRRSDWQEKVTWEE